MKRWSNVYFVICAAVAVAGCGGGDENILPVVSPIPVVSGLSAQGVSGNTVTLSATATDDIAVTGYCFKTVDTAPSANDACFQVSPQLTGAVLSSGVTYYVWAKDSDGNMSASLKGPCSIAGYAASDASGKNTVCMMTDKGEMVLELDAVQAPITTANFLQYVNDGFYSATTFHRVIPNFMIQGGGFVYSSSSGYQYKSPTYPPIYLEKTSGTGLSNLRGTIAMARTSVANSATSQFFINVVDNTFLDSANQLDGNGYAVFGKVIFGLSVADLIKAVPVESGTAGSDQPVTPLFIQWAYQLK